MPTRCFVPTCRSGYDADIAQRKRDGVKNPSLFSVPRDPSTFELWKKAIPRLDRTLGPRDHVCELHFRPEDIECFFETKLFDGNIFRIGREKNKLKPGIVPSIFQNVPGHSSYIGNKPAKKYTKRKNIINLSSENKSKKAKISCPDNDFSHQKENENILMEVIIVHDIVDDSSPKMPSFCKKTQKIEKTSSLSLSDSEEQVPEQESQISPCLSPEPLYQQAITANSSSEAITENCSKQNLCNKILTESSSSENLLSNYFTPLKDSVIAPTKNYSRLNDSRTIPESEKFSKLNYSTKTIAESENFSRLNNSARTIVESENYSSLKNSTRTIIESENYPRLNNSTRTIAESEEYCNQSVCDVTLTKSIAFDVSPGEDSDQCNDDGVSNNYFSTKRTENNDNIDKIKIESDGISAALIHEDYVSFDFLKANVNMFGTNNSWWRVNTFDDFIVFSRWSSAYTVERRIVITKDLTVKVYLKDRETTIGQDLEKFTIHDITKLIYRVENLRICRGIDMIKKNCAGFLQNKTVCNKYLLCLNCINWRKEEKKRILKRLKESENCIELLNFNLIT